MPQWDLTDLVLLACLVPLVLMSGFFSGSETALFGMSQSERLKLRESGSLAARAVEALLAHPRMMLITVLLGNMVANVFYFVISSVLMLRLDAGVLMSIGFAIASLLLLVLLGEVLPKMIANTRRTMFATWVGPPLLTLHGVIGPLRIVLDRLVVAPLNRLTAPRAAPRRLDEDELNELLELSGREHEIDAGEQQLLRDVIGLSSLTVRDVMTPRVRVRALPLEATRDEVRALVAETRLTKIPVYGEDLDDLVGVLSVKPFLRHDRAAVVRDLDEIAPARFVPEMVSLEQLLDEFRRAAAQFAIVVDEFGGTAGVVALEDVVEEIVGDIVGDEESPEDGLKLIGFSTWSAPGDLSLQDFRESFRIGIEDVRATTLGGLILERLGRGATPGDEVTIGRMTLRVETVAGARIEVVNIVEGDASGPGDEAGEDNA